MTALVTVAAAVALVGSLPCWLPTLVVRLRMALFARINGDEGIEVPGATVDVSRFRELYAHPAACGRSKGAGLSDLFWYWLAPGPEVHQEHLEPGERYVGVARTTRRILAQPKDVSAELATRCARRALDVLGTDRQRLVRLRDLMMPIWADYSYELVFGEPCPADARALIVANADDVVTALKCSAPRHMRRRLRLTAYLLDKLASGEWTGIVPPRLSPREAAFYLQGAFFNTAVVQMSEAMAHLLMAIAQHPAVQARLVADLDDDVYLDHVIDEAMRRYPLFGIAHRITAAEIALDGLPTLPAGSVLCFNYPEFHAAGFERADEFNPDRWDTLAPRDANHVPFGVTANRPCPARGVAPVMMRAVARETLRGYRLASSAAHTRSMPNRGPCLLVPRDGADRPARQRVALAWLRIRDPWEDVWRGVAQLVFGTYMVWDARRLRLCRRYFETHDTEGRPPAAAEGCPVRGGSARGVRSRPTGGEPA